MANITLPSINDSRNAPGSSQWNQNSSIYDSSTNYVYGNTNAIVGPYPVPNASLGTDRVAYMSEPTGDEMRLLQHLSADIASLLNRENTSDCWLNVNGTYMAVHKCILAARSNVFASAISNQVTRMEPDKTLTMQKSNDGKNPIIDIKNTDAETMKLVVLFMYTARCDININNASRLLDAAGRYDIKSLKVFTAQYLINHIDSHNVLDLLHSAYKYNNLLLKQKCIEHFIDHAREITELAHVWKTFAEKHPEIVNELLYWSIHKDDFLQRVRQLVKP